MPDDKRKTGAQDRARVAGGQDYEVDYLVEKTGVSIDQAREPIKRHGNNRETLEREAKKLG